MDVDDDPIFISSSSPSPMIPDSRRTRSETIYLDGTALDQPQTATQSNLKGKGKGKEREVLHPTQQSVPDDPITIPSDDEDVSFLDWAATVTRPPRTHSSRSRKLVPFPMDMGEDGRSAGSFKRDVDVDLDYDESSVPSSAKAKASRNDE